MANETARRLRKRMTVDEQRLWGELRGMRRRGFHFRKQAPIDNLIVDFVCYSKRLVIEVDGVQHHTPKGRRKDSARDDYLASQGFKVLRFTNGEVTHTLEGVVLEIMAALGMIERPPSTWTHWSPPPLSPPRVEPKARLRRDGEGDQSSFPSSTVGKVRAFDGDQND